MNKVLVLVPALLCACVSMTRGDSATAAEQAAKPQGIQMQAVATRQADYCGEHTCRVTIKVDRNCVVSAVPYALVIGGMKPPVTVVWKIDDASHARFAGTGIYFKEEAGRKVFHRLGGDPGASEYVYRDDGAPGIYHYSVTVALDGRTCDTLDPTGVNDM
jgi:hypothetical protein